MNLQLLFKIGVATGFLCWSAPAGAAVILMDQIGDPADYLAALEVQPSVSQIFDDFPAYSSLVIEDVQVTTAVVRISEVEVLFRAAAGFPAFAVVERYQLSIFSNFNLAASGLAGDVFDGQFTSGSGASVTQVGSGDIGLISLSTDIVLAGNATYWIGVAAVASQSIAGTLHVLSNGGPQGGNANSMFANPGEGLALDALTETGSNSAYRITVVPEPGSALLLATVPLLLGFTRRRGPPSAESAA